MFQSISPTKERNSPYQQKMVNLVSKNEPSSTQYSMRRSSPVPAVRDSSDKVVRYNQYLYEKLTNIRNSGERLSPNCKNSSLYAKKKHEFEWKKQTRLSRNICLNKMSKQNTIQSLRNMTFKSINSSDRKIPNMEFFLPIDPVFLHKTQVNLKSQIQKSKKDQTRIKQKNIKLQPLKIYKPPRIISYKDDEEPMFRIQTFADVPHLSST